MVLESWAMLHGDLLLRGWQLSDVSFYTTELPEYMLVELARGFHPDVVRICSALTFTLLVVLAAAVAHGSRPTDHRTAVVRAGITVAVMIGPTVLAATVLLNDPDHTGTAVPVLLALLILDRGRRRWWVPLVVAAVLGWALVGDSLVLLIGVAPLVIVGGARSFGLVAVRRRAVLGRVVRPLADGRGPGRRRRRDRAERADQGERRLRAEPLGDEVDRAVHRAPRQPGGGAEQLPGTVQRRLLRQQAGRLGWR